MYQPSDSPAYLSPGSSTALDSIVCIAPVLESNSTLSASLGRVILRLAAPVFRGLGGGVTIAATASGAMFVPCEQPAAQVEKTSATDEPRKLDEATQERLTAAVEAVRKIRELKSFGVRLGYPSPSPWVLREAKSVVEQLGLQLAPTRVVPMADGGIGLVFKPTSERTARITITNEEEIVATFTVGNDAPEYRELASGDASTALAEFFQLS